MKKTPSGHLAGYLHPDYAASLAEFGAPRELPRCKGWVLVRSVAGSSHRDAMGCYPLFACQDWSRLHEDLETLEGLVSLALVTDPFGDYSPDYLRRCFPDVMRPFKEHYVIDLSASPLDSVCRHHRRYARKALRHVVVERCEEPLAFLDDWVRLYDHLIERHRIRGIPAFSRRAFEIQLQVPGLIAFRAVYGGKTVGMLLWYVQGEVGYYHLGASSPAGYEQRASFALFWRAFEYFIERADLRWLNLGAGAGLKRNVADGLSRFKRGWATGTRTAYFCGRIFDREKYEHLVRARGVPPTPYFPAYRLGEFG